MDVLRVWLSESVRVGESSPCIRRPAFWFKSLQCPPQPHSWLRLGSSTLSGMNIANFFCVVLLLSLYLFYICISLHFPRTSRKAEKLPLKTFFCCFSAEGQGGAIAWDEEEQKPKFPFSLPKKIPQIPVRAALLEHFFQGCFCSFFIV